MAINIFKKFLGTNKITLIMDGEKTIIACDAVTSENHQMIAEATQFEIEDGSDISDHVINRGKTLTIEGIVSDDPITLTQKGVLNRTLGGVLPGSLKSKLSYDLGGDDGKPSKEAFDQFEFIHDNKIPVTLITGLKKYDNMIMEEFSAPRDSKTVRALRFTATFRQVNIVSTILEAAPIIKQDVNLGAQSKKNIGKQGTGTVVKNRNNTIFDAFIGWVSNGWKKIFPGG